MINYFSFEQQNQYGYYEKEEKREKISPFQKENLERLYNLTRFPNRIRREAKTLRKYGLRGNCAIVLGYFLIKERRFLKGCQKEVAIKLNKIINIPVSTLKVKINQLKDYVETGYDKQISYGIIKTYKQFKDVPLKKLNKVFSTYEDFTDEEIEERLKMLLIDSTFLDDEQDHFRAQEELFAKLRNDSFFKTY